MRKISRALTTGAAALSLVGMGVGVAAAESQSALACTIRVDQPNVNNDAWVGRVGCSNVIAGEGFIYEDRGWWPDDEVGVTIAGDWGVYVAYGSCGNGPGTYYSEFHSSSGASAKSAAAYRC